MLIDYIINTAAGDMHAQTGSRGRSHVARAQTLREKVVPQGLSDTFDRVIIVGQVPPLEKHERLLVVNVPPLRRDRSECLRQREIGARFSGAEIMVFGHDDHALEDGFHSYLCGLANDEWDILIPQRRHAATGEILANGSESDPPYMGGHVLCMRRELWARVPWTSVDVSWWDIALTEVWEDAGAKIVWSDELYVEDVEAQEGEK